MRVLKVNSLPLKDVIESLAQSFNAKYKESCDEYYLDIPDEFGEGQIRGINFDNGLGIIIYECQFKENIRIEFTVDNVHPIKFIYSAWGTLQHFFANEENVHEIEQFKSAIVASELSNGHVLNFKKDEKYEIVSLEIDREKFSRGTICEMDGGLNKLQNLLSDIKASSTFYHEGFYGLEFMKIFEEKSKFVTQKLVRKFHLESIALRIFVNQLIQYEDDLNSNEKSTLLRFKELERVKDVSQFIKSNFEGDLSIPKLSERTGLNPNKLQSAFKYLFNNTVNEYVLKSRLEESRRLLHNKELIVSDVVSLVGFKSKSYFSKIFKEEYDMSPSEYRNLNN